MKLFYSVIFLVGLSPLYASVPSEEISSPWSDTSWEAPKAIQGKWHWLRVLLIASDEDFKEMKKGWHEVEHALEPPMKADRFWARKKELLKNPQYAFDLRRSFQNIRRVIHLSKHFENPFIRNFILTSASTGMVTHGSEFVTGVTIGTWELAHGNFLVAAGWYGLGWPGLYDFACYIGQACVFIRPTRYVLNTTREFLFNLFQRSKKSDPSTPGSKIVELLLDEDGNPLLVLQFTYTKEEIFLEKAWMHPKVWESLSYSEFKSLLKPFGWNVLGALRQIRKLILRNDSHLIKEEKTFVYDSHQYEDGVREITFRLHAVWIKALPETCAKKLEAL